MYILEMTLNGTPAGLMVQKKEEADATAAYQQVVGGDEVGCQRSTHRANLRSSNW